MLMMTTEDGMTDTEPTDEQRDQDTPVIPIVIKCDADAAKTLKVGAKGMLTLDGVDFATEIERAVWHHLGDPTDNNVCVHLDVALPGARYG